MKLILIFLFILISQAASTAEAIKSDKLRSGFMPMNDGNWSKIISTHRGSVQLTFEFLINKVKKVSFLQIYKNNTNSCYKPNNLYFTFYFDPDDNVHRFTTRVKGVCLYSHYVPPSYFKLIVTTSNGTVYTKTSKIIIVEGSN